ncbi:MAG: hypothetical protein ABI910_07105 [Gemmatimonadota bacterium]
MQPYLRGIAAAQLIVASVAFAPAARADSVEIAPAARADMVGASITVPPTHARLDWPGPTDSIAGRSGKLKARIVSSRRSAGIRVLRELFGDSAAHAPGIYQAADSITGRPFSLITLLPLEARERGKLGSYRIGFWPGERRASWLEDKAPDGFIEVTTSNQDTPLSDHFRLRDFLTHDQQAVWPKYLVLRDALIDKLELVISDLQERGIAVSHMQVMSGFRTPQYNAQGVGVKGGRATDSRHQYGDAADVFVDNNRDGRMDDLNRDGRVDMRDARILMQSVERVEAQHPDLVGGAGLYKATRAHGPFVHVDVRGSRARWGLG